MQTGEHAVGQHLGSCQYYVTKRGIKRGFVQVA